MYIDDYNKQLYLREISRLTNIPSKTVQNAIKNLEKEVDSYRRILR